MSTSDEIVAELEKLRAENEKLKRDAASSPSKTMTFKVSEKGAVSVYGMGRFPVTLYKEQWLKLLERADDLRAFITDNEDRLKTK
jgi:hypothetical protein